MVMNCDALWANDAKRNFIYRQLRKYRPIGTNFSTSQLSIV